MKTKKRTWFVAISYVDQDVDIARTDDYEKAVRLAQSAWLDDVAEWQKTKVQGVSQVELFDDAGRVVWSSDVEPSGMQTTPHFQMARGMGPALGPV